MEISEVAASPLPVHLNYMKNGSKITVDVGSSSTIPNNASIFENETESEECFPKSEGYDDFRFALVVYFGTPIAVCGVISNAILIKFFGNRKRAKLPTFYLFALAIFDFLLCAIYLPFFTADALAIYYSNAFLYRLWHSYSMCLYGTSRVVQFASTYMVVCATLERFVIVANLKSLAFIATIRGRYTTIITTLIMVVLLRFSSFFDYAVDHKSECPLFQDYTFVPLFMARDEYRLFNFYVIFFLHILLPFLLLLILNLLIIALTKRKLYNKFKHHNYTDLPKISLLLRKESIMSNHRNRSELRYATRTMVMITFTYLLCNIFNVIITVMENVFKNNNVMFNDDGSSTKFYTYTADLVSIMVTINSFARVFVYFFCNPEFRFQLLRNAKNCVRSRNDDNDLKSGFDNEKPEGPMGRCLIAENTSITTALATPTLGGTTTSMCSSTLAPIGHGPAGSLASGLHSNNGVCSDDSESMVGRPKKSSLVSNGCGAGRRAARVPQSISFMLHDASRNGGCVPDGCGGGKQSAFRKDSTATGWSATISYDDSRTSLYSAEYVSTVYSNGRHDSGSGGGGRRKIVAAILRGRGIRKKGPPATEAENPSSPNRSESANSFPTLSHSARQRENGSCAGGRIVGSPSKQTLYV